MARHCPRRSCPEKRGCCRRRASASCVDAEQEQFRFGDLVSLSPESIVFARKFTESSGLCAVDVATAYGFLAPQTEDGFLSVSAFQSTLSNPAMLHQSEAALSNLQALFNNFDRAQTGYARFDELFACFAVLLKGSKSDKLQFLFDLFDENGDGRITIFAFRRFVMAVLTFFHWLQPIPLTQLEAYCRSVTDVVFEEAVESNLNISFEAFGTWYNQQGNQLIPWIELLDTVKWNVHRFSDFTRSVCRGAAAAATIDSSSSSSSRRAAHPPPPSPSRHDSDSSDSDSNTTASPRACCERVVSDLRVTADGASIYNYVLENSRLGEILSDRLLLLLLTNSTGGLIPFDRFLGLLQQFYRYRSQLLNQIFSQLFRLFDPGQKGQADVLEIAGALVAFSSGTKSEKLLAVFHAFDKDSTNSLSYHRLQIFLEAFLRTLNYLTQSSLDSLLHRAVLHVLTEFAAFTGLPQSQNFDLDIFGDWYNQQGNQICPWIELLNPNKWPVPSPECEAKAPSRRAADAPSSSSSSLSSTSDDYCSSSSSSSSSDDSDSDEEASSSDGSLTAAPLLARDPSDPQYIYYAFPLVPTEEQLALRAKDCQAMYHVISVLPWKEFSTALSWSEQESINVAQFRSLLEYSPDKDLFLLLFRHLDTGRKNALPTRQLITSLSLFYRMTKTDKLSTCFHLFASQGVMGHHAMVSFLFTILWSIHFIQGSAALLGPIKEHIGYLADRIFEKFGDSEVSFAEFADWYNQEGFNYATWLELLDHDKWPENTVAGGKSGKRARRHQSTQTASAPASTAGTQTPKTTTTATSSYTDSGRAYPSNEWERSEHGAPERRHHPHHPHAASAKACCQGPCRSACCGYAPPPPSSASRANEEEYYYENRNEDEENENERESVGGQGANKLVFKFVLNSSGVPFSLFGSDVQRLQAVEEYTHFYELSAKQLQQKVLRLSPNSILSSEQFMDFIGGLFLDYPSDLRFRLNSFFEDFFNAFDSNGNKVVNKTSIAVGMTLFAGGEKSSKLSSAFELMAPNQEGYISRESCRIYFLSFLIPLFALSEQFSLQVMDQFFTIAESTVSEVLDSLFQGPHSLPQMITYAEFAKWYSAKGMSQIQWIELYALSKWPFPQPFPSLKATGTRKAAALKNGPSASAPVSSAAGDSPSAELPIQIDITTNYEYPEQITITPADIALISSLIQDSKLLDHSIESIVDAIDSVASAPTLSLRQFDLALNDLIDAKVARSSIGAFRALFQYLDYAQKGLVDKTMLQIAMLVFTGEKKSPKLTSGYTLLAKNIGNLISASQMAQFLAALLAPIVFALEAKPSFRTILSYCSKVVEHIFADMGLYTAISFDNFSSWYMEKSGCQMITWLELLDWSKWILPASKNVFVFPIGNDPVHLRVDERMTQRYDQFVTCTRLGEKSPQLVSDVVMGYGRGSSLTRPEYNALVRQLIPFSDMEKFQVKEVSNFFNRLFEVQSNGREIPKATLLSSLVVFVVGKKSEKLLYAFKSYSSGKMHFFSLCNFLFALLFPILLLKRDPSDEDITKITEECRAISSLIFDDAHLPRKGALSFEQFCEWYSQTGYQYTNWLELLDGSKWPFY